MQITLPILSLVRIGELAVKENKGRGLNAPARLATPPHGMWPHLANQLPLLAEERQSYTKGCLPLNLTEYSTGNGKSDPSLQPRGTKLALLIISIDSRGDLVIHTRGNVQVFNPHIPVRWAKRAPQRLYLYAFAFNKLSIAIWKAWVI